MRKGSKQTEEAKAKIKLAKLGKKFTPEHSAKISEALKGSTKTAAHKKALSESVKAAHVRKANEQHFDGRDPEALMRAEIEILKGNGEH